MSKNSELLKEFCKVSGTSISILSELVEKLESQVSCEELIEWKSTPNLKSIIETDGNGNFRDPLTLEPIKGFRVRRTSARLFGYGKKFKGKYSSEIISLPKFVALIYHPNLNGSLATRVINNNPRDLRKENVEWVSTKNKY